MVKDRKRDVDGIEKERCHVCLPMGERKVTSKIMAALGGCVEKAVSVFTQDLSLGIFVANPASLKETGMSES